MSKYVPHKRKYYETGSEMEAPSFTFYRINSKEGTDRLNEKEFQEVKIKKKNMIQG